MSRGGFEPVHTYVEQNDTVYAQVRYRKQEGSVTLTATQIVFCAVATDADSNNNNSNGGVTKSLDWTLVAKHQVSPVSYPKALLKLVSSDGANTTFQLPNRFDLDRIRKDVTARLQTLRNTNSTALTSSIGKKRPFAEIQSSSTKTALALAATATNKKSFGDLDNTELAVTRSSLLAANPCLRQQHKYLVQETQTVAEEDFWKTHRAALEEEYARISGLAKAGTSSLLQSHLPQSGRVKLGVEEMRQIFILYPAVHKAYEEKVPLELSDEQFWRKYLESEYFHRDRGRMGTAARNHAAAGGRVDKKIGNTVTGKPKPTGPTVEEQEARAAAVGTNDLFSRYDQKLQEESGDMTDSNHPQHRQWGRTLAVGQFDLASTFETERGRLLQGPKDNHPANQADDDKGARVIQKYNRHWAMVLHPDQAIAGSNLLDVARRSVHQVLPGDQDALAAGGVDEEMQRLVEFASAAETDANHAAGLGLQDSDDYEQLTLQNVEAYYSSQNANNKEESNKETDEEAGKRHAVFGQAMAAKTQALLQSLSASEESKRCLQTSCFPPAALGRELLSALTKKMAQDSRTEAASLEVVNRLPAEFRERLQSYFRRSSELLRHFFGLRRLEAQGSTGHGQKLARIVLGMETVYREMEGMRKDLPQTENGEMMRKMCLPIMDQLDWAFKLHREGSGGGGGGGFVAVEEL
jgi:transcription initiation factor TFIIH subunit 1